MPDDLAHCNISQFLVADQQPSSAKPTDSDHPPAKPGAALSALRLLPALAPLPDSNLTHMPRHEREYALLVGEQDVAEAEATLANVYTFERRRRQQDAV